MFFIYSFFSFKGVKTCFFTLAKCPALTTIVSHTLLQAILALSLLVSLLKSVFSAVMPRSPAFCLTRYTHHLL